MHKTRKIWNTEIAHDVVISFFFTAILFLGIHFLFGEKINTYLNIINMISIEESNSVKNTVRFDEVKKRLINYPLWGSKFATLLIPSINLEMPVYQGDTLDILRYGIGHYSGSFFPGEGGSIILAGHNNYGYLYHLPDIKIGEMITLKTIYGTYTYELKSTKVINAKDNSGFPFYRDKEVLMIYTCYPVNTLGHKTHRYVVYAELVGVTNEK